MKKCPPDVAAILYRGLLRIRMLGGQGEAERCAREADHLHNIPHLIADFTPIRLAYYWRAERPAFARSVATDERDPLTGFEALWERLRPLVERICGPDETREGR
jgi:hypothetical protein